MIVYEATKKQFMDHVTNDEIAIKIEEAYLRNVGRIKKSEFNAWDKSMQYMYKVLNTSAIPDDSGVAIEYKVPATSRRVDFIISGLDNNDKENAIIIELKQWQEVEVIEDEDGIVKTAMNNSLIRTSHPSYQAWTYATLIKDYNEAVQKDNISLFPCAYLHNYYLRDDDPLVNKVYDKYLERAPVYVKGEVLKLREFICKYIKKADHKRVLYKIENGKIKPSKSLQDALVSMLDGNDEFYMIDDQKVVFETALKMSRISLKKNKKQVLIIEGGPGTGKSVLAINLMVKLTAQDYLCQYVTKNSAPREVYCKKLKGSHTKKYIDNLFKNSGAYYDSQKDEFDILIVDEAHRLNEKSGLFKNLGENQIKEIINASRCSIFFLDENQRVTLSDIGNKKAIIDFANKLGAEVRELKLESQFRCNGSDGYLSWIDDVLEIRQTANYDGFEFDYDIKIVDNPNELKKLIIEKNQINNKARIVSGYCWEWISEGKTNKDVYDIVMPEYNFSMSWNLSNSKTWAIDPFSVEQAGCIHTCQGLEFDYVGVIIGEDLRYENSIVTDFTKRAKSDKSLSGIKKLYKQNKIKALEAADEIIKNTYRTLMTRGMKGCYIYCVDKKLSNYLKDRLSKFYKNITYKEIEERNSRKIDENSFIEN
ncbi:ATPase AAA [Clostridium polyendosporum]|uniref:ATPase AAA n=1 Tax=Clostridium polyendosporum TaxID=69208 RepID=A0A919VFH9_9CLOT|nr:DUF2075 domain-containing protein [Clostridium polyendosporum]GIM28440.1 ATPase AAA [Clostridium polyendosporum]